MPPEAQILYGLTTARLLHRLMTGRHTAAFDTSGTAPPPPIRGGGAGPWTDDLSGYVNRSRNRSTASCWAGGSPRDSSPARAPGPRVWRATAGAATTLS